MHAQHLGRLLRQVLTTILPAISLGPLTQGCYLCSEQVSVRRELRPIAALPAGWRVFPEGFFGDNWHTGRADEKDIPADDCAVLCGSPVNACQIVAVCEPPDAGSVDGGGMQFGCGVSEETAKVPYQFLVVCEEEHRSQPGCGRRPSGLAATPWAAGTSTLSSYFAELAYLEAASVDAFEILRRELEAHAAPACLVRAAARAARDEVRHARIMASLTRRHGGVVRRPSVQRPAAPRPVLAIALENAREGCVNETYGALAALWQAERAMDRRVRAAFAAIARDEVRHAALGWRVAAWADTLLLPHARAAVAAERARAANELLEALRTELPKDVVQLAGAPAASAAIELARGMITRLLCAAAENRPRA